MPGSRSFPSGHTAAAFAFATGAGRELPAAAPPLAGLAALVGYSRIHTGVHYPVDVIAGALCGVALAEATGVWLDQRM
jgi:undecaprenyl-diphosphatase